MDWAVCPALPIWIADQVRNDVASCPMSPRCGYCLEASMTAARSIRSVDSRLRGNDGAGGLAWMGFILFHPRL